MSASQPGDSRPRPRKGDVSRPRPDGDYSYKREFYRDSQVAQDYDAHRFGTPGRKRRDRRKWATILKALEMTSGIGTVLDIPCGTGRFTGHLLDRDYAVLGADISAEMMDVARGRFSGSGKLLGFIETDAEHMALTKHSVDCVMSIRFLHHVDSVTRVQILREMSRISRRWVILDYRHRYSFRYTMWRVQRLLRLTRAAFPRVSRAQLEGELSEGGLTLVKIFPVARVFSDKWIVLCTTPGEHDTKE